MTSTTALAVPAAGGSSLVADASGTPRPVNGAISGPQTTSVPGWADPADEFPVLAEVPELAGLLATLRQVDRLIASAIESIIRLQDASVAETVTGVALEQWLLIVARRTGTDRRMLLTCAQVCRRLPGLLDALSQGRVSWSQLRTLVLQVDKLPRASDQQLDDALVQVIDQSETADPDRLGSLAAWLIADLAPSTTPEPADSEPAEFLALQPRLDGSGGRFFDEAGPQAFAILENATNPGPPPVATGRRFGYAHDPDTSRHLAETTGRRRLARLIEQLDTADRSNTRKVPTLLVVAELDTLCDRDQAPARLLHHLAGGRMLLDSAAARRLTDQRGADLRTIVIDDRGGVVGIGRQHRVPTGWLSHATLALHDTCTEPGCTTAALSCDLDHARPWHPTRPHDPPGPTDIDNLAPLCRPANRTKDTDGWHCTQTTNGTRTWHHPRSGLTVTTSPTSTRPRWLPRPRAEAPADAPDHRPRAGPIDGEARASPHEGTGQPAPVPF
ncbi:DUF222 domain-containing protein [Egicoccus sp. AB-alg6-2]|uniref:HNH endonuclease signature motif containing protein n=1 Tax=Egicoccus sp. AB-alg6-2 TaxID=3242692 RepID=UPI00359D17B8